MTVSEKTKQAGETRPTQWDWVERSIWTDNMLAALEKGVKGGVWFSLIDKVYRPSTLYAAWLRPRKKSLRKLKDTLRAKTKRCNGNGLDVIIAGVNSTLRGWFEYFKQSHGWTFPPIDGWVRRRLRSILRKRSKRQGISRGHDHFRWPNRFFQDYGLFSLEAAHRALRQSSLR